MPVTTRRQSRRLPNSDVSGGRPEDRPTKSVRGSEGDDDPMDGSITELSASEDEEEHEFDASEGVSDHEESDDPEFDDDFEGVFNQRHPWPLTGPWLTTCAVTFPAAKRRKLDKAGKASSSKSPAKMNRTAIKRRIHGRLQNMLSLPFDVLFLVRPSLSADIALPSVLKRPTPLPQIFSELGPMDLVNLARTNKALRHVLMSRKSMCVWIVARRNAGVIRVPDPPEDMSEPAWALLLFGPAVCSVRSHLSLLIVFEFQADSVPIALLYEERSPCRLSPPSSFVHRL